MYDLLFPQHTPSSKCEYGCANWSNLAADGCTRDQSDVDAKFEAGSAISARAGRTCATPGNDPWIYDAWCYCRNSGDSSYTYCAPPANIPTQINVQLVNSSLVVVNFVTVDHGSTATAIPQAEINSSISRISKILTGYSSFYTTPAKDRSYSMHYINIPNLHPNSTYSYRVRASTTTPWSQWYKFKSLPPTKKPLRFALFGDMGVFKYNNMGNLADDIATDAIDFVAHIGDHAYEYNYLDGQHGDGYMDAYQEVIARVPWVPALGNHEFLESDFGQRFTNITHGTAQYRTSKNTQYYSLDVGLLHFIVLDLDGYFYPCDKYKSINNCGLTPPWTNNFDGFRRAQLSWLTSDLEAIDRSRTPWIILATHHPLYCSSASLDGVLTSRGIPNDYEGCVGSGVKETEAARADLEPLLLKYGVDISMVGHEHNYETSFPMKNDNKVQSDYNNPKAPIYILSGAGGAPSLDKFGPSAPWSRSRIDNLWTYSRITILDSNTLRWQQIDNDSGKIVDDFTIIQKKHGPFY